ncbi:MAG: chemotaxis protein CheA [Erythrobacter sp.]
MDDLLADFVAETREMLEASEGELIAWEADPSDQSRLDAIFRFVHTVKGNCGFFDFPRLEQLSHAAEDVLAEVRAGRRVPDAELVSAVLAVIDRIGDMANAIEAGQEFPKGGDEALIAALQENAVAELSAMDSDPDVQDELTATKPDTAPSIQRSIRLPVDLLDRVMSGVSDMVLARNDLAHRLRQAGTQPTIDGPFERLSTILTDVREAITRMRMQRIEHLFGAFPRLVRDLSGELGKQVMIDLEGGDVELDREMIEMIRDPLTHIIRNAIDHGIEKPADRLKLGKREIGLLSIAARQAGNRISIVITDDGRGLDEGKIAAAAVANGLLTKAECEALDREEILQLVFEPGLSTAKEVSAISGRGVGLDIVRDNLEKVGGSIKVTSTFGEGSLFYLQIPLTLSIIAGLTVEIGGQRFAISQSYVEEILDMAGSDREFADIGETAMVTFRGERVPCLQLGKILDLTAELPVREQILVMLRLANGDIFALAVDRIHNHGDLVVKPLAPAIMATELYGGTTLLEDGNPVLLLDTPQMALNAGLVSDTRSQYALGAEKLSQESEDDKQHAMLFTDLDGRRKAMRLELIQRIETINSDVIEIADGRVRAVVDSEILPLIGLSEQSDPTGKVRVLRLSDGSSELLYAVGRIEDAVELQSDLVQVEDEPLIEAIALVDGHSVSVVDGHAIFGKFGSVPKPTRTLVCRLPDSNWAQTVLAPLVKSAGYEVTRPTGGTADVIITLDASEQGSGNADGGPPGSNQKIIQLRSQPDAELPEESRAGSIYRYDRDALLAALRRFGKGEAA